MSNFRYSSHTADKTDRCNFAGCTHWHSWAGYPWNDANGYWEGHYRMSHAGVSGTFQAGSRVTVAQTSTNTARKIDGDALIRDMIELIRQAPDPFIESGIWITKITNAISKATREESS